MNTKKYEVILTDTAKEDLDDVYEYISKNLLAKKSARNLIEKIERGILILEENPYSCLEIRVKPHKDHYRKLVIDKYIALYEIDESNQNVIVYRIIYGKMDYLDVNNN